MDQKKNKSASADSNKLKILYVIGSLEVGGAEKHLVKIARNLRQRQWKPEVFSFKPSGPLLPDLEKCGIPVHSPGLLTVPFAWLSQKHSVLHSLSRLIFDTRALFLVIQKGRPDVIHFYLPGAYVVGGFTTFFARNPIRIMSRRSLNHYQKKNKIYGFAERLLHPWMHFITGNSKAVLRDLRSEGVSPEKLRWIPNGVETGVIRPGIAQRLCRIKNGFSGRGLVFLMIANLIPYKGHADLIDALVLAKGGLPRDWMLFLLGRDDGLKKKLEEKIRQNGLGQHVVFAGSVSDVRPFLACADVGLLCSHEEGFSNALLEYMAAGLPVIATRVGGNPEAVVHGKTGLLVPPRNPPAMAKAILKLTRASARRQMGKAGRERVVKHYSQRACVQHYEQLYQEALRQKQKPQSRAGFGLPQSRCPEKTEFPDRRGFQP
jgi:glycosyltransferase involved in cell wall biosynthesis